MKKVCSINATWIFALVLIIPGSVLHAADPRSTQDQAVQEAQPASTPRPTPVPAPPVLRLAIADGIAARSAAGAKGMPTPPPGSWGVVSTGTGGGGIFRDTDSQAEAWLGSDGYGVFAWGSTMGGYFEDSNQSGFARVGVEDRGITAYGLEAGGFFGDFDHSGHSYVGFGDIGIVAQGNTAGGNFMDTDHSGYAYVAIGDSGISAYGTARGGYFEDLDSSGYAIVGNGDFGITAHGNDSGGYFVDADGSGYARVGHRNRGIWSYGNTMGGYFEDLDSSGHASLALGDVGIDARGNLHGGYFVDSNDNALAWVARGEYGIEARGDSAGGYFRSTDTTGYAYVGSQDYGIEGYGDAAGGYFVDTNGSGQAFAANGNYGIRAYGDYMGGFLFDHDGTGYAYLGYDRPSGTDMGDTPNPGEYGVYAGGSKAGGYFEKSTGLSYAYVADGQQGIQAYGYVSGAYLADTNSSAWARVGYSTYKIYGNGTVNFVQNHPYDPSSVIVYAAPEGDEAATYTRGKAALVDGEATVALGETFKWVTNPDLGLTAFLTPVSDWCDLYVAEQATDSIVVRSRDGLDCGFNYIVYGLRIGFEESSIVQEKEQESYIPSMADHRKLYERRPDLKSYNSLERFKGMRRVANPKAELDLSRAYALRDAIIEFDPAVHELPMPPGHEGMPVDDLALEEAQRGAVQRVRAARGAHDRQPATDQSDLSAAIPVDDEGNIYAPSFRPPSREVATLVDVSESVEPGDVLVIDRSTAGFMRRGFEGHDSGVVGVVLGSQSLALSGEEVGAETSLHAEVAIAGVVTCNVDATYGAIWPGNLLVTSPTSGHAMRTESPLPGTIVGKALEPLEEGTGTIRVLVMLR